MKVAPLALVLSSVLFACSSPSTETATKGTAADLTALCANQQRMPSEDLAERARVTASLEQASGAWKHESMTFSGNVITFVERSGPTGAAVEQTFPQIEASVREFFSHNWKLFGFRSAEAVGNGTFAVDNFHAYLDVPYVVDITPQDECQDAFSGIENTCQHLQTAVAIHKSGVIQYVNVYGGRNLPVLTLDPHPVLSNDQAAHELVGTHLTRHRGVFEPDSGELVDYGVIARNDIRFAKLTLDDADETIHLTEVFDVTHGAGHGEIHVDACSGAVIESYVGGP